MSEEYSKTGSVISLGTSINKFKSLFLNLDSANIPYVVLRKYQLLPESMIDEDIDMIIPEEYMKKAEKIILSLGLKKHGMLKEIAKFFIKYYRKFISNPSLVFLVFDKILKKIFSLILFKKDEGFYMDVSYGFKHYKYKKGKLDLDIWNHLAYYSPSTRISVRASPVIEKKLIDRRVKYNGFYIASPPDELLHIICRVMFDYKGKIKPYYKLKLEELVPIVYSKHVDEFKELLNINFFKAGNFMFELLEKKDYTTLLEKMESFSGY